jgi:hypothetical protein
MSDRMKWSIGIVVVVAAALLVFFLWPAPDPLVNVDTVAVRIGNGASSSETFDFETELGLVLSGRDIRVVSDESTADLVLSLDDFRVNLGDIEISLTEGSFRGKASALCIVTDVTTGKIHTMDFVIQIENGDVRAKLVGRKVWEFWK